MSNKSKVKANTRRAQEGLANVLPIMPMCVVPMFKPLTIWWDSVVTRCIIYPSTDASSHTDFVCFLFKVRQECCFDEFHMAMIIHAFIAFGTEKWLNIGGWGALLCAAFIFLKLKNS